MDTGRRYADAQPGAREIWMGADAFRLIRDRHGPGGRPPHPLLAGVVFLLDPELPPWQVVTHCPELMDTMAEWGPTLLKDGVTYHG